MLAVSGLLSPLGTVPLYLDSVQIYGIPSLTGCLGSPLSCLIAWFSLIRLDSQVVDAVVELDSICHESLEV